MRKIRLLSLALLAVLTMAGCGKDDHSYQVDPSSFEATNRLMGCKWVCDYDHSYDSGTAHAHITETIIFVDNNYAVYYWDYKGEHWSDDNSRTGMIRYTFNGVFGTMDYVEYYVNEPLVLCSYFEMAEDGESFTRKRDDNYERVFKKVK